MPLPAEKTVWPPPAHTKIHREIEKWNAWYTGDRDKLADVYGGTTTATHYKSGQAYSGGVAGAVTRWFWGQPVKSGQRVTKLHVPAAADIATTSAGLLFAEPPTLTVADDDDQGNTAAQDQLDEWFGDAMWDQLMDAGELQAGLGGVYARVGWDNAVSTTTPLFSAIGPDYAVPRFRWGRLVEVTFTWVLHDDKDLTIRHLENHTLGRIEHGLFMGDRGTLGRRIPLTEHPNTAGLATTVDEESGVLTELPMLDVVYVPNRSARVWRGDQIGQNLGQADIADVERSGFLDALDESWSSWMRDIRLGKARAVTSQDYLESSGPGRGGVFDLDQELFVGLRMMADKVAGKPIELIQPLIRFQEHAATTMAALERVIDGAGYSAQTFGLSSDVAITATESNARERKTNRTRGGKIRRWTQALPDIAELMFAVSVKHLNGKIAPVRPKVEFPPAARDSFETLARTVSTLGDAASTATKVRTLHPTWTKEQVDAEVALIQDEASSMVPIDPFARPDEQHGTDAG